MMEIIYVQIGIFTAYMLYVLSFYGIQHSISASWYVSKHKFLFTLMCWGVGVLQCTHAGEHSLFFASGAFLCFTGAATSYKDKGQTKIVHFVGAAGSILFSILALFLLGVKWVLLFNIISVLLFWLIKPKND